VSADAGSTCDEAFRTSMDVAECAPAIPTHMDVGSACGCREHPRADPHGCGECLRMPGAPAGRPTWMWGVPADAGSVRGPTHMDVGSACRCRERPRADPHGCGECLQMPGAPAGRYSVHPWTYLNLLLQFRYSVHPWTSKRRAALLRPFVLYTLPAGINCKPAPGSSRSRTRVPSRSSRRRTRTCTCRSVADPRNRSP